MSLSARPLISFIDASSFGRVHELVAQHFADCTLGSASVDALFAAALQCPKDCGATVRQLGRWLWQPRINVDTEFMDADGDNERFDEWTPLWSMLSSQTEAFRSYRTHKMRADRNASYMRILARVLQQQPDLVVLSFSDYGGGAECAAWTGHAMRQTTILHSVAMPNNALGVWGFRWLCEGLLQNTSVRTILLGSNTITEDAAVWVARLLAGTSTLTDLSLSDCSIADKEMRALAAGLAVNRSLIKLDLTRNAIGVEGLRALCESLRGNRTLQEVVLLPGNSIADDECMNLLGVHLSTQNRGLRRFRLTQVDLTNSAVDFVLRELHLNCTLRQLELSLLCVWSPDAAFLSIGHYLARTKTLKELEIHDALTSVAGMLAFCDGLEANQSLTALTLQKLTVSVEAEEVFVDSFPKCRQICSLQIVSSFHRADALLRCMRGHPNLAELSYWQIDASHESLVQELFESSRVFTRLRGFCNFRFDHLNSSAVIGGQSAITCPNDAANEKRYRDLLSAISSGDFAAFSRLLAVGVPCHLFQSDHKTLHHVAVSSERWDMVARLAHTLRFGYWVSTPHVEPAALEMRRHVVLWLKCLWMAYNRCRTTDDGFVLFGRIPRDIIVMITRITFERYALWP